MTRVTATPRATQAANVPPMVIDSSSGWAWTATTRRLSPTGPGLR